MFSHPANILEIILAAILAVTTLLMLARIAAYMSPKKKETPTDGKKESLGCELNDIIGYELIHIINNKESAMAEKDDAPTHKETATASLITVGKDIDNEEVLDDGTGGETQNDDENPGHGDKAKNDDDIDIENLSGEELEDIFQMMDARIEEDREPAHATHDNAQDEQYGDEEEYSHKSEGIDDIDDGMDNLTSEMTEEEINLAFYPRDPELYEEANRKAYEMMDLLTDAHDREMDDKTQRAMEALSKLKFTDANKKDDGDKHNDT